MLKQSKLYAVYPCSPHNDFILSNDR